MCVLFADAGDAGCMSKSCGRGTAQVADVAFLYEWKGNIDKLSFREPSGIAWHPVRKTLFVVGDEGDMCEIRPDGRPVKNGRISEGTDFEGVTVVPESGLVYVAVEGDEEIWEVDPQTFLIGRRFSVPREWEGREVFPAGGDGIEGMTFIPDDAHPQGGTFLLTNQSFGVDGEPSLIAEVVLPLRDGGSRGRILRLIVPEAIDLSGLHYEARAGRVYAVSDALNLFLELDRDGTLIRVRSFPGSNQEGIAMAEDGFLYIAQDSGGILRIRPISPSLP